MNSVEFATSCYEGDWELILKTGRIGKMIAACRHPFTRKTLYLNNFKDFRAVTRVADELKEKGIIDRYVRIDENAEKVVRAFEIRSRSGYNYLIQDLTAVYRCEADYLLHFTGDAIITNDEEWIDSAIARMQSDPAVIVANPLEQGSRKTILREALDSDADFYRSFGFSDQCYLIEAGLYRQPIYNEENELSLFYPAHARDSFEERVYRYMRNHQRFRITHKRATYRHKNLSKNRIKTWLALYLGVNKKKYGL